MKQTSILSYGFGILQIEKRARASILHVFQPQDSLVLRIKLVQIPFQSLNRRLRHTSRFATQIALLIIGVDQFDLVSQ